MAAPRAAAFCRPFTADGERQDRLWRLAYFLRFMPIGLIKELLLAVVFRRGTLFGFAAEGLVSQQPNLFLRLHCSPERVSILKIPCFSFQPTTFRASCPAVEEQEAHRHSHPSQSSPRSIL